MKQLLKNFMFKILYPNLNKKIVMIMGVQRSGTSTLFKSLGFDFWFEAVNEGQNNLYFINYFLRPIEVLMPVLSASTRPLLLKAISETKIKTIADIFTEYAEFQITIIWLYRDPVNVFYSQHAKWNKDIEKFLDEWVIRNQKLLNALPKYQQHIRVVRYEDLVKDKKVFDNLCKDLSINGRYEFRSDSQFGRSVLDQDLIQKIELKTTETLKALDRLRSYE